jgi:hypothetical protein
MSEWADPGEWPSTNRRPFRIAQLAQDGAESLEARIEDEDLDGLAEAIEVREGLDAYQQRHAR